MIKETSLFYRLADHDNPASFVSRFRRKRYEKFNSLMNTVPRPMTILDVGGLPGAWETMGYIGRPDVEITLLNIEPRATSGPNIRSIIGDARQMPQFRNA